MLKVFEYQQCHSVAFDFDNGELLVNATQMARPFGKQPRDFLKANSIKEYISALSVKTNLLTDQIVKVIQGGDAQLQGTWMHRKLALRFAQWLSPEFALWVDEQIEELLTNGRVSLPSSPLGMFRYALEAMEQQQKEIGAVKQDMLLLNNEVTKVKAKIETINDEYYALAGYFKLKGRRFDLETKEAQRTGKQLTRESKLNGYTVSKAYHAKYGSVNTYHVDVLKAVLGF